jgi:hypothetical protein
LIKKYRILRPGIGIDPEREKSDVLCKWPGPQLNYGFTLFFAVELTINAFGNWFRPFIMNGLC